MGASTSEFCPTTLELRHVSTAFTRPARSERRTGRAAPSRMRSARAAHFMNASATAVGCMPLLRRSPQASRRAPATTHTLVVPSPASTSWLLLISTSIFAAGWSTFILDRIVAPSLLMRTSPSPSCISLSMPRGPKEVRIAAATAFAATILDIRTSLPFCLSWRVSPVRPDILLRRRNLCYNCCLLLYWDYGRVAVCRRRRRGGS
mmetsp:Transcript_49812/g.97440  ORF Transcript_49812/g.97440 Transcript_49812/m.97440 type:complete len:205 (-) Transcript_49812:90-704(-)